MLSERLTQLKNPSVQNLAWAIGSPSLIRSIDGMEALDSDFYRAALERLNPWLMQLDDAPAELEKHLVSPPTRRLGIYFERLISFWLRHDPAYELLAENLQVREGGHTHGAFDFLVRSSGGAVEHWEVALKYYLKRYDETDWSAWVGPNKVDRLDKKLSRMRDHQLPLSSSDLGREMLLSLGISDAPRQVAFVKGMLFNHWREGPTRPVVAAPGQPQGVWVQRSEFLEYARESKAAGWFQRVKPDWLVPASLGEERVLSTNEAHEQLKSGFDRPVMFSALGASMREQERLFLVPDRWAETEA